MIRFDVMYGGVLNPPPLGDGSDAVRIVCSEQAGFGDISHDDVDLIESAKRLIVRLTGLEVR